MNTEAKTLKTAAALLAKIAYKRARMPILSHICIDGNTLRATDLENTLTVTLPGDSGVACCVDATTFSTIAKTATEPLTLRVADNKLHVAGAVLPTINVEEFPCTPNSDETITELSGESTVIKRAISATAHAISKDVTRFNLLGLLFESHDNQLRIVATDGHRLALYDTGIGVEGTFPEHLILPPGAIATLRAGLEGNVNIRAFEVQSGKYLEFMWHMLNCTFTLTVRTIDAEYPNYRLVLPDDVASQVTFINAPTLLTAVQATSTVSTDFWKALGITPNCERVALRASSPELGSRNTEVKATVTGEIPPYHISATLLIAALKAIGKQTVTIDHSSKPLGPVTLRSTTEPQLFQLIMPLRME